MAHLERRISELESELELKEQEASRMRSENAQLSKDVMMIRKEEAYFRRRAAELEGELVCVRKGQVNVDISSEALSRMGRHKKRFVYRSEEKADYLDFAVFRSAVMARTKRKYWKPIVGFALGVTIKEISAWEATKLCPARWLNEVDFLSDAAFQPTSHRHWAADNQDALRTVLSEHANDLLAAQCLTERLGFVILESSVAYYRRKMFRAHELRKRPQIKSKSVVHIC
ncbi:hypothetical protein MMSR116_08135 [Methylobacterium mesophilicum SR1.6/6]|uniref:Uncharacterized protein n=1 Tax=Methylobacterium mesophilicum SR1.6/6 TaxID=908290 RepID=A0A6B9FGC4_9HYPH|nr:hypothetical protein [Methylobacterium mesophilicum]QGY01853.1 hypothetical protein MMSR116_08135 [Methylobacterium mesophilicum SR1.6/6]